MANTNRENEIWGIPPKGERINIVYPAGWLKNPTDPVEQVAAALQEGRNGQQPFTPEETEKLMHALDPLVSAFQHGGTMNLEDFTIAPSRPGNPFLAYNANRLTISSVYAYTLNTTNSGDTPQGIKFNPYLTDNNLSKINIALMERVTQQFGIPEDKLLGHFSSGRELIRLAAASAVWRYAHAARR